MILSRLTAWCVAAMLATTAAAADMRLAMFEEDWCVYCEQWNAEIGGVYDKTTEGKQAPLLRIDIHGPRPEGLALKTGVNFTPTFILIRDGEELARLEGYPGEDFFWALLNQMLQRANSPVTGG